MTKTALHKKFLRDLTKLIKNYDAEFLTGYDTDAFGQLYSYAEITFNKQTGKNKKVTRDFSIFRLPSYIDGSRPL